MKTIVSTGIRQVGRNRSILVQSQDSTVNLLRHGGDGSLRGDVLGNCGSDRLDGCLCSGSLRLNLLIGHFEEMGELVGGESEAQNTVLYQVGDATLEGPHSSGRWGVLGQPPARELQPRLVHAHGPPRLNNVRNIPAFSLASGNSSLAIGQNRLFTRTALFLLHKTY